MKQKNEGGRPRKEIDFKQLDKLLGYGHTGVECADLLAISYETLVRRVKEEAKVSFDEYYKKRNGVFKSSLRRNQSRIAFGIPKYKMRTITKDGVKYENFVYDNEGNKVQEGWFLSPHPGMNIWLGKQYLDQKDKIENTGNMSLAVTGFNMTLPKKKKNDS
ncbi:MAG: hypothetical protein GY853_09495 [PVC group bacterium]|nr:hypothetical protein [PVC group bacterium]